MKIGLYFGSFNPVHVGHLIIANYALSYSDLNQVWFVVSPQNPFKKSASLLNKHHRLHMIKSAIDGEGNLKASNVEFNLPKPSYTVDSLSYLKEKFPEAFKLLEKGDLSEDEFYERVSAMGSYLLLSEKLDPESLQTGFAKNFGEKGKAYMNKVVGKWFNEGVVQGFSKGKNEGIVEGKAEGIAEGKLKIILNILRKKFGKISANNQQGLSELSDKQLDELSLLLFELNSLEDLADWLKNQLTTK